MQLRPATRGDHDAISEIDGTIDSVEYLHVDRSGDGMSIIFRMEKRPLRERLIEANRLSDETSFAYRQIIDGHDEGLCIVAEHDDQIVAAMAAVVRPERNLFDVVDLRVDFDVRREGLATAMLFQATQAAREREFRAIFPKATANNLPANSLLLKCGLELSGLDTRRSSNHDLAKEITTLLWYAALD